MTRRLASAGALLLLAATAAPAQVPFTADMIPTPTALARLGLKRQWFGVVPLLGAERVAEVSLDQNLVFVQTDQANFHVYDSESGRYLWGAKVGSPTPKALGSATNSTTVFVCNSNQMFALSRKTGALIWKATLPASVSSPTSADDDRVYVGLLDGKLDVRDAKSGMVQWQVQTRGSMTSRPIPAGKVVAFASADGKVYISLSAKLHPLIRWASSGTIEAPMGHVGVRRLIVPSSDRSVYAVDLFTGDTFWNYPTGAPIKLEPIVTDNDVYVVNSEGNFTSLDAQSGSPRWTISTLGGPLLAVSSKRIYLESRDGDLFVVDRADGNMLFDPRATHQRAGVNIRPFEFGPTNRSNDRLYFATKSGLIVCAREIDQIAPLPLKDPKGKPFGYIPPEGYPDATPLPPPPVPAEGGDATAPAADPNAGDTPK